MVSKKVSWEGDKIRKPCMYKAFNHVGVLKTNQIAHHWDRPRHVHVSESKEGKSHLLP
jgi:hypothetical protein